MPRYRHELKYLINYPEYEALAVRMKPYFTIDPHAVGGEYTIRSLYFDDYFGSAYEEKDMGVFFRKKYRIRIYNFSDEHISLERKLKKERYIYKESAPLTRDQVESILMGEYGFLLKSGHNLHREFYFECVSNFLRPRVIVDYDRVPFTLKEGTVRVTFDKGIRAAVGSYDIFDDTLSVLPAIDPAKLIMEVKFTQFLPKLVKELIIPRGSELVAASKYVMCCDKTAYLSGPEYYVDERSLV